MNLKNFLQTVPEFAEMTNAELDILDRTMVVRDFADGISVLCSGHEANDLYLIMQGAIEIQHEEQGAHGVQVVKTMHTGEMLGLHSLISHHAGDVCCVSKGNTKLAMLPRTAFDLLYQSNSPLPHHFQRVVARQLARDYQQILKVLENIMIAPNEDMAAEVLHRHIDNPA